MKSMIKVSSYFPNLTIYYTNNDCVVEKLLLEHHPQNEMFNDFLDAIEYMCNQDIDVILLKTKVNSFRYVRRRLKDLVEGEGSGNVDDSD